MSLKIMQLTKGLVFLISFTVLFCQYTDAPSNIAAALLLKIAGYEQNSSSGGDYVIHVLGSPEMEQELKAGIGQAIGKSKLVSVTSSNTLPDTPPNLLFIGDEKLIGAALEYAHSNHVFTATNSNALSAQGVSLGILVGSDGKPKIVLNLTGSKEENLNWNPAVMKIAKTIK